MCSKNSLNHTCKCHRCASFKVATSRQNQVLSRPSVCRPLAWLWIVITQTTSNCGGGLTSSAARSELGAFLFSQPATRRPGDVFAKQKKNKQKKKPHGYKHPNYTNSSLPQTRAHSASWTHQKCACCFSGFTCRNKPKKKKKGCCCLFTHIKMRHCSQYILDESVFATL